MKEKIEKLLKDNEIFKSDNLKIIGLLSDIKILLGKLVEFEENKILKEKENDKWL